ncbi:hypothetical protein C3408_22650 [Candidatus Pantoea alvi]|nr:hypothetical protein C3408_22650 [Pantoea alvi]
MRERPILLNGDMVRAVLNGSKTQTRRIMTAQPDSPNFGLLRITDSTKRADIGKYHWAESNATGTHTRSALFACPFGAVGDRLWVRETFGFEIRSVGGAPHKQLVYRASKPDAVRLFDCNGKPHPMKWTPSLHMRRKYSRITLEITGVRVERLQDISRADAIAEGGPPSHPSIDAVSRHYGFPDFSRSWFGQTWWSIYGADSWQANPWVWVIEFKRVEGE